MKLHTASQPPALPQPHQTRKTPLKTHETPNAPTRRRRMSARRPLMRSPTACRARSCAATTPTTRAQSRSGGRVGGGAGVDVTARSGLLIAALSLHGLAQRLRARRPLATLAAFAYPQQIQIATTAVYTKPITLAHIHHIHPRHPYQAREAG